ncbi:MAG TPA: DUF3014 domain-containing protein [Spongiibacteraceae bacterium]|jgi:hypothetical protein|nr:DUF3014 domain-containing protein [Spongiibacteraceae bacterium]HUH37725.1 DUF3014 domain-containing protein [Spongiibacteraceae bacterium]
MKHRNLAIVAAIVVIIAIAAGLWSMLRDSAPTTTPLPDTSARSGPVQRPDPTPQAPAPAPSYDESEAAPVDPVPVAESLQNSDATWRDAAERLLPDVPIGEWLAPEQQLRRWTALVEQMAEGQIAAKHRPLNYTIAPFAVDADKRASAANYTRTTVLVNSLTAIPPERAARYYRAWQDLFEDAYRDLGKPGSFDGRLEDAIENILAADPPPTDARLEQPSVFYRYADPELEKQSALTKALWRLGPENQAKVQAWVKELAEALEQEQAAN